MADHGRLTSPTLAAMLRAAVAAAHPDIAVDGRTKEAILDDLVARDGWAAAVRVGAAVDRLRDHPVVHALVTAPTLVSVVERWMLLERFGHTRNRVVVVGTPGVDHITVRHVARDAGPIAPVSDLFVWGLLIALFELAGARGLTASFGRARRFHPRRRTSKASSPGGPTHTVTFRWRGLAPPRLPAPLPAEGAPTTCRRVDELLRRDPLVSWTARDVARALGMSLRSLQRALHAEGSGFRAVAQRARLDAALTLLVETDLPLADVAFCAGFADQAHFTRTVRRHADVPPSALRRVRS